MLSQLDLNADVGEGFPFDLSLLDVVTSANVACGFHAGDARTMRELTATCAARGVAIGAQVSYRDRAGFGRRRVDIGYDALRADLGEQVAALRAAAAEAGAEVTYLKPHGALYNRVVDDPEQARAVVDAADGLPILGLDRAVVLDLATGAGVRAVPEFFADRAYTATGRLLPRSESGSVITDVAAVTERIDLLVSAGEVRTPDGLGVPVRFESICVHGDTAGAVELAGAVRRTLESHAIAVRNFG